MSSLEASSETLPTRAAPAEAGDIIQLNARNSNVPVTPRSLGLLASWAGLWSWQVSGAGMP